MVGRIFIMNKDELNAIYLSRPFKIRNADEYDLEKILDLFVDPTDGLFGPFDFSNSIIKGKMGSGKTMYLRANYAYYLYTLVPCLIEKRPIVLPVYIKLSDFQNIHNPENIYYAIIIKIVEEIVAVCDHLKSANELALLHKGANTIIGLWSTDEATSSILSTLQRLTADEYIEKVTSGFSTKGSISARFFEICTDYSNNIVKEIKKSNKPSFRDIVNACEKLLSPFNGKLLILFDEIGSIDRSFFKNSDTSDSYFEILMNQLRTLSYVRMKLAVYPHSSSDVLKETRYGDVISLECDITNNADQYNAFYSKTVSLIERYIEKASNIKCATEDLFDIAVQDQLLIEQLINASEGNMRRLVYLLDSSLNEAYSHNHGKEKITAQDVLSALRKHGSELESQYQGGDIEFLNGLVKLCRNRSTYRFTFPYKSSVIGKYTNLSAEHNIINVVKIGTGRQGTVYSFDYAYCVYKDIPTHYVKDTEKIDRQRSRTIGEPIKRIAQLSDDLFVQSMLPGKIEGEIIFLNDEKNLGFIKGTNGQEYFFTKANIIKSDTKKVFHIGSKVIFFPARLSEDSIYAAEIEIL